mgnify:CR=1 FL=1|tara:strand:+ start:381 stop:1223 length:843 start_codon:yes stop_codon:yes gene_type:complete
MIDRTELADELVLRETVRKAINVVVKQRQNKKLLESKEEGLLRDIIRSMLPEGQTAVASVAKHANTGINALEDLLKNTNVLSVLETGYKSLTTDLQQRESYKNHILNAIKMSLAPEESRKEAGEDVEIVEGIDEEVDIEIGDSPEDDPDFINVSDEEVEEVEVDEKEEFGLDGEDKTGRNRAFTDFQDIEKVILTAFDDLDNSEDITMFEEFLLKNMSLYFEKYEGELQTDIEPPPEAENAVADEDSADPGLEGETDVPEFELQEVMKLLDLDDIIENLL